MAFRILLRLFAANPSASFVHWVYQTSDSLLVPFRGIFNNPVIGSGYVLDFTAMFALVVYGIVGYLFLFLVDRLSAAIAPRVVVARKRR